MTQVTYRGLVQALLFCFIMLAAALPHPTAPGTFGPDRARVDWREATAKLQLTKFIVTTYHQSPAVAKRIVEAAYLESVRTELSPLLLLAIMAQESSFKPKAQSGYGAVGLMQVVPRIHKKEIAKLRHPAGIWHPESNIRTGAGILKGYLKSAGGNLDQALKRYSGNATRYAARVRGHWSKLRTVAKT
jgi:soluble lytic murein transglycosylase-like protein